MHPSVGLVLAASSLLAGCYLSHEREAPSSVERSDGGADAGVPDGDAGTDAGPPPACTLSFVRERRVAHDPETSINAPDLFWTGERIGAVVFESRPVAHPIVSMTHVDRELEDVAPLRRVGEEAHGWGEATWTGEGVGVCWDGDPGGLGALRFREVERLDGPLGPRTDFEPGDGPCLDLVWAHGRYAMTWRVEHAEGDEVIVETAFQLFDRDRAPIGERHVLAAGPYPGHNGVIVPHPDGFLYVASTGDAVRIARADTSGRITRDVTLDAPHAVFAHADLREGRLAVLSLRGPRETRSLVLAILDQTLSPIAERVIEDGAPTASYPRVLARPEGWVLLWGQGSRPTIRTMVMSLDPDGVPLAPRRVLYEGNDSSYGATSPISVDDTVYVGISHPEPDDPTGREGVYVQRWDCDAPPDDPCRPQRAQAGDCDGERLWGWRWTGSQCEPVLGCDSDCVGSDCDRLAATRFACESDRSECGPRSCAPSPAVAERACGPVGVPSNQSSTVTLTAVVSACPCDPEPECRVTVSGPEQLALELVTCDEGVPECDCAPGPPGRRLDIPCRLPPMQAGTWTLHTPGGEPFELLVHPPWETPSDETLCRGL